ncbi:MAG: HD domain-containing phosphohydrolase [bacterium]|nr:HD domain-containing phosphohydrolase [bacterium]
MNDAPGIRYINSWVSRCAPLLTRLYKVMHLSLTLTDERGHVHFQTHQDCHCVKAKGERACAKDYARLSSMIVATGSRSALTCGLGQDLLGVPIGYHRNVLGSLILCLGPADEEKKESLIEFLEEIARLIGAQIGDQIELDSLAGEISIRYEELNLIYATGHELGRVEQLNRTLERIVTKTVETLNADLAMVSISHTGVFKLVSRDGTVPDSYFQDPSVTRQVEGLIRKKLALVDTSPPYVLLDGKDGDSVLTRFQEAPLAVLAVPVMLKGDIVGCLNVFKAGQVSSFTTGDVRLLAALGEQISILVTNATLYEHLREFLLNVIKAFVASIEAKDAYTRGHSERVNQISLAIAEIMGLSSREKLVLNWASILHDIGKIGIPEEILTKPEKLTAEEYAIIQEHPEKGTTILHSIDQLRDAIPAILHHHERFDGHGYPGGLEGPDIPLFARIIAVADTYDAMRSKRSYREAISQEETLAEIRRVAGSQLDPEVVADFLETLESQIQRSETLKPSGL